MTSAVAREDFDLVVLGAGSAGKYVANAAAAAGRRVAVVEALRVGGECPYVSCVPSKVLLHEARLRRAGARPGSGAEAWAYAVGRRDEVVHHRDDAATATDMRDRGITVLRGHGRIVGHGDGTEVLVEGGGRPLHVRGTDLLIATGSTPSPPPVDGLADIDAFTSDRLLSSMDLPGSLLVLGGGAVGSELASVYAAYGTRVTLVESAETLLPQEDPGIGETLAAALEALGVTVLTGISVTALQRRGAVCVASTDSGADVVVDRVLVATGRRPALAGTGVEVLGLSAETAIPVDRHNRVPGFADVYAAGDVTDLGMFTHTADYHARIVLAALAGTPVDRDDRAIPRVVYTDPSVAAVGLSAARAADAGLDVVTEQRDLASTVRAGTEGDGPLAQDGRSGGVVILHADRATGLLVGGAAVGTQAESWMGEITTAIRAAIPIAMLAEVVHPFPAWSEILGPAFQAMSHRLA